MEGSLSWSQVWGYLPAHEHAADSKKHLLLEQKFWKDPARKWEKFVNPSPLCPLHPPQVGSVLQVSLTFGALGAGSDLTLRRKLHRCVVAAACAVALSCVPSFVPSCFSAPRWLWPPPTPTAPPALTGVAALPTKRFSFLWPRQDAQPLSLQLFTSIGRSKIHSAQSGAGKAVQR